MYLIRQIWLSQIFTYSQRMIHEIAEKSTEGLGQTIPFFLMAYRAAFNESKGKMPVRVLFGREMRLPCDLECHCTLGDVSGEDYVSKLKRQMDDLCDHTNKSSSITWKLGTTLELEKPITQTETLFSPTIHRENEVCVLRYKGSEPYRVVKIKSTWYTEFGLWWWDFTSQRGLATGTSDNNTA